MNWHKKFIKEKCPECPAYREDCDIICIAYLNYLESLLNKKDKALKFYGDKKHIRENTA